MSREGVLTNKLRRYDKDLFALRNGSQIHICRKIKTFEPVQCEGYHILSSKDGFQFIFALTNNWSISGRPVEIGIDPIINRLKAMDLWSNPDFLKDFETQMEVTEQAKRRDFKNTTESFLYDFHRDFKKTFNDTNTSNLKRG